ncbi:MAG: recombination protein O N-terminal domain-containing protein [Parcubacteria group bacterium]|nr:recombination protein O N-terminal domain-containing protein [Parcubacteria group bacterium]
MYEKYTTDAVILTEREQGERDKVFALYTHDFGLVYARASAVRTMSSRMRSALTLFAPVSVSLVRGTRGWRVTGARPALYTKLVPEGAHTFARIARLCLRLVRGEERNEYLFNTLRGAREACAERSLPLETTELLCVARMLYALGYLSPQALTAALFTHTSYASEDTALITEGKQDILVTINSALAESHL